MDKSLLLISCRPEDLAFATEVAKTAELDLQTVKDAKSGAALIAKNTNIAVILADTSTEKLYKELEDSIQEAVGLFSDRINANAIHFLSSENLENVQYLVQSPLFGQITGASGARNMQLGARLDF